MTVPTGTIVLPAYFVKGEDAVVVNDAVRTLVDELVGAGDAALTVEDFVSAAPLAGNASCRRRCPTR